MPPRTGARATALFDRLEEWFVGTLNGSRHLRRGAATTWALVTPLGRTLAVVGVACWVAGWWLGWKELMVAAALCLLLLLAGVPFILGNAAVSVVIRLEPPRVVAGDSAVGQLEVMNRSGRSLPPFPVQLPVGDGVAAFDIPPLAVDQRDEQLLVIPAARRGVIPIGPATSVRSDPLGLYRRSTADSEALELLVHPQTVPLTAFGTGLLRDLEGLATKDVSLSDLAFHALRDYAPGDDYRHVHWRSSAKVGRLQIRQFLDTRRSTICVAVDARPSGYSDPAQFELALEAAGSVSMRACKDGLPAVLVAGVHVATGTTPHVLLDALARAELNETSFELSELARRASARRADISVALLVSGSERSIAELQLAASRFPVQVQVLALRVDASEPSGIVGRGRATVLQLHQLSDLAGLLRMEVSA